MPKKGKLYLIPVPLGEGGEDALPAYIRARLGRLQVFIAERARTARRFIKATLPESDISQLTFHEIDKRTEAAERVGFLQAALDGQDMGLLSEAGCPGVADPGALVVAAAHEQGVTVVPLVGPSSLLLALMASGMNGQHFQFHGYLPPKKPALAKQLKALEQRAMKEGSTQLFIETPYRNKSILETAIQQLSPHTRLCIAADLTLPTEYIRTQRISQWRKHPPPDLHKRPAVFLIGQ